MIPNTMRDYSKVVSEMTTALVDAGFKPEDAQKYAPNLCNMYEDMSIENKLIKTGQMPECFKGLEGKVDASTPQKVGMPISQDQFVELGQRYAKIIAEYLNK